MKPPQLFKPEDFEFDVVHEKHICDPNSRELALKAQAIFEKWFEDNGIGFVLKVLSATAPQNPETDEC